MNKINSKKLGLAIGTTGVILYLACMCFMLIAGNEGTTWVFNSILHGLDVTSINQVHVPFEQTTVGIILTFILGWIAGYLIGIIYNWSNVSDKS